MNRQLSQSTDAADSGFFYQHFRVQEQWLALNRQLDRDAADLPNEKGLAQRLDALPAFETADPPVFWLTVARLAELTLKLAGDYADTRNFQAAGDLLANPRRIDVWQRDCRVPTAKARHRSLSGQFAEAINGQNPVLWLSRNISTHIQTPALLPQFMQMLALSDCLTPAYVAGVDRRMCRIADTIGFLNAWQIDDGHALGSRIATADSEDGEWIAANLCRFDLDWFFAMGDDIEKMVIHGDNNSQFLKSPIA